MIPCMQAHSLPILVALLLLSAALLVITLLGSDLLHGLLYPLRVLGSMVLQILRVLRVLRPRSAQRSSATAPLCSRSCFHHAVL